MLRLSRTWAFGAKREADPNANGGPPGGPGGGGPPAAAGGDAAADPEVRVAAVRLRAVVRPLGWASIAEGATL